MKLCLILLPALDCALFRQSPFFVSPVVKKD